MDKSQIFSSSIVDIPVDLFLNYPQLTNWLKSKRAFDLYTSIIAIHRTVGALDEDDCERLYAKYCNCRNGPKDLTVPQRVSGLALFLRFHNSTVLARQEMLEKITLDQKSKELLWALKFKCAKDLEKALTKDTISHSDSELSVEDSIEVLEDQQQKEIEIVEEYFDNTIASVEKEEGDTLKKNINEKEDEKKMGNGNRRRQPINIECLEMLKTQYPFLWNWMKQVGLDKLYALIIEIWNTPGTAQEAYDRVASSITEATKGEVINAQHTEYLVRQLKHLDSFYAMNDAQRRDRLKTIPSNPEYDLLKILRNEETKTPVTYRKKTALDQITKVSVLLKDQPVEQGEPPIEVAADNPVQKFDLVSLEKDVKDSLAIMDDLIADRDHWRQIAQSAEAAKAPLIADVAALQDELKVQKRRFIEQGESIKTINTILETIKKARTIVP